MDPELEPVTVPEENEGNSHHDSVEEEEAEEEEEEEECRVCRGPAEEG